MLKRFLCALIMLFTLVSALLLSACADESCEACTDENGDGICDECELQMPDSNKDGKILYRIKVLNAEGEPLQNMIVSIYDGEEKLAVKITDEEGLALCSEANPLNASENAYRVVIADPQNSDFYYDNALAILEDGKEEITLTVYETVTSLPSETLYLNDADVDSVSAPILDDGGYYLQLKEGRNYFVFVPTRRGQYKLSADGEGLTMGYYGSPHFVQTGNLASYDGTGEVFLENGSLFFNIRIFNVGEDYHSSSRYVFRIDSAAEGSAILSIKCVDPDLPMSKEEIPWEEYILPENPEKFIPDFEVSGLSELTDFDITDENLKAVYNEEDGFYHLGSANGPVILVKLTVDSKYIASFKTIMETTRFCAYVYGEDEILDRKINYHDMMQKYIDAADEALGVYPLTAHMKEALTVVGDAWGWYDESSYNNILSAAGGNVVAENAYLFACCYYEAEE